MLDIRFVREHPDEVKENIKKKFQDAKLPLVDEVINLDAEYRAAIGEGDTLRANRNKLSKQIGMLMGQAKKDPSKAAEAEEIKKQVTAQADRLKELETKEAELQDKIRDIMYTIPQMIDPSVPIGPDDSCNVEVQRFGDPVVPDYPIPYHVDIMESFDGIDLDAAGRVSGNGFYYLLGDIARLHEAVLAYARDFMIDKGFTYVIPPFMMHGDVVKGVMSFPEMDAMMYKIEGEDLYLIGTSEHTMIGRFIDQTLDGAKLPLTLTSYSPCFRKEKGAHGIEERGIYRIHQFEKQEMIVVCKPEDSMTWYDKLWHNSVELFRSMEIPVRQLECCSGDLADLKVKSCDIEAWSPRQQKYFEVCSCSNLGDAQARRLRIRYKDENGKMQLCHTLNNTCVAPPRMLIAFLENNLQADGTVRIGANFLNDRLTPATFDYHTFNYYLNVTFLPFLEVALTSTAFMNERRTAFVNEDRSVSVRVRLLGERRVRPAIAVGSNDLFTSSDGGRFSTSGGEGNQYFGSTYVALSKHFVFSGHRFGVHLAYNVSMNDRFRIDSPVSGGVSFSPRFCRRMNLIAEYDTRCFNLGANALIARHVFVQVLLQKLRYPSCGLCFEFGLWGAGKADRNRRGRSLAGKVSGGSASEGPLKKAKY